MCRHQEEFADKFRSRFTDTNTLSKFSLFSLPNSSEPSTVFWNKQLNPFKRERHHLQLIFLEAGRGEGCDPQALKMLKRPQPPISEDNYHISGAGTTLSA